MKGMLNTISKNYEVLLNDLILVNYQDKFVSSVSKWDAHTNTYLRQQNSLPHRAFSIFLFNDQHQLLLQKRSEEKKTFPLCWTNTCCSHPNMVKLVDNEEIKEQPIRQALHRALIRQLKMHVPRQNFYFMEKILYKKEGEGQQFGEYEVDYVFLGRLAKEAQYQPVPSEIAELAWVGRKQMPSFIENVKKEGGYLSPWFLKMYESNKLAQWWDMIEREELKDFQGENAYKVTNML